MTKRRYTKESLETNIKQSKCWADVCRSVGIKPATGSQTHLKKVAIEFSIDFTHFTGSVWNKGKTDLAKKDALDYCFKGSTCTSHRLKKKLIRDGYKKDRCEICGITEWMGEISITELDHIDSDHSNNEFDNLQLICPNCHLVETRKRLRK